MSGDATLSELERHLALALHNGDQDQCVAALRRCALVIPISDAMHEGREQVIWPTITTPDGRIAIVAYTSVELMHEATEGNATYGQQTSMAHLASGWPDNTWILSINPRTPLHFEFESGFIGRLVCPDLTMHEHATPEHPIPVVQKPIRLDDVHALLSDTSNRVSGYVQRSVDVARFKLPEHMLNATGIYDHEPYLTTKGSMYFLRWFAVGNDLYRVPLGGSDEAQREATAGWVIEPAPFVGLGMAPHPNSIVQEFRVNAVVLPDGAEFGELTGDGEYYRRAMFSSDSDEWVSVHRVEDLDDLPSDTREQWAQQREGLLERLRGES